MKSALTTSPSKSALVKAVFEDAGWYLTRREFDIRIRAETIKTLVSGVSVRNVLDIGCGDGSISLPLLNAKTTITLMDFSATMLLMARSKVPPELAANVRTRNEDFMAAPFDLASFDLIICVGVLAHVDSPDELLKKMATLLTPGGSVILQFTDSYHFIGRFSRALGRLTAIVAPPRSPVNVTSRAQVGTLFDRHRFRVVSHFRYALPPLHGLAKIASQSFLYKMVRLVFGTVRRKRNSWLGNEHICLLAAMPVSASRREPA
jgi:ubiquinone/menaquinone biosynthesis C-methylase UbiE